MTITAYPLQWPAGWKRTTADRREFGHFGKRDIRAGRSYATLEDITVSQACKRLRDELERMAVNLNTVVISTNVRTRLDGLPYSNEREPADPGAAVYWRDTFNGKDRCMAIDRYTKVAQNLAALAATIDAMRAIERHGGAAILDRAFTGFTALPAPIVAGMKRPWHQVLECHANATREIVDHSYRRLASRYHPDREGGSSEKMSELNAARDDAYLELGHG